MSIAYSFTWDAAAVRRLVATYLALVLLAVSIPPATARLGPALGGALISVIVREQPAAGDAPERAVEAMGGQVGQHISIIEGFVATVPASAVYRLEQQPTVLSVTPNGRVRLLHDVDGFDADKDLGSMFYAAQEVLGAGEYWNNGFTGKGVDVALIDSGVAPVEGLTTPGKLLHGPDLSFESQAENLRYLDTFGHGTHMAGIIAGRDSGVGTVQKGNHDQFLGVAPDARIVSLKVADAQGWTDVSQVIAAIDWVVQHRRSSGLNIRVLNLSFGTDGTQSYVLDPLAYAVEVAWRRGIFVSVAAGNGGYGSAKLNNPAYDPFVMAVGAAAHNGTYDSKDDTIPSFSSTGDGYRNPDLVAPGKSIVSLRVPNSYIDASFPSGRANARFFRGSGTSQAAAMVSGAAALVIQQRPTITPDQLKRLLTSTAGKLPKADPVAQGAGMIDLKVARDTKTPKYTQLYLPATGLGSLDLSRGTQRLVMDGVTLQGERDIFGAGFDSATWAPDSLAGNTWSGGTWNGNTWSGNTWSGNTWSGNTWSGNTWSGNTWSGNTWSGNTWSGNTWSGNTWSGNTWSGNTWSGNTWSGAGWD